MSDPMQVGKVKLGLPLGTAVLHGCQKCGTPGATLFFPGGYLCPDCAHPQPEQPKPPKRVAVQASVYADRLTVRIVITANDGTVWLRSRDNWERLPDLPQE